QVEPSTEVARDDSNDSSKHGAKKGRGNPHRERNPSAVNDPTVDVSSEIVGAEPVGVIGRCQRVLRVGSNRVVGREGLGKSGCHYQDQEENGRERSQGFLATEEEKIFRPAVRAETCRCSKRRFSGPYIHVHLTL